MVWVEMSLYGRTDLYVFARRGVTEARHCGDILEPVVGSYAGTIGDVFILKQDNALPTQFSCTRPSLMTKVSV